MKKKRVDYEESYNTILITRESTGQVFFEVSNEITTDLAEAVAIMMKSNIDDNMWEKEIDCDINEICPSKCLYWLTGGIKEWRNLDNYKKPWSECNLDFQEEFGLMIISILKKSKKLKDIRDGFKKYLSLPILYDFAISRDLIK